eukprot:m51a1_g1904 hypothetical protein (452) ;mRNA; f:782170-787532
MEDPSDDCAELLLGLFDPDAVKTCREVGGTRTRLLQLETLWGFLRRGPPPLRNTEGRLLVTLDDIKQHMPKEDSVAALRSVVDFWNLREAKNPGKQAEDVPKILEWLEVNKSYSPGTVLIFLGDFNLPASDPAWAGVRELGWTHCLYSNVPTNKQGSKEQKQWDNIFVRKPDPDEMTHPVWREHKVSIATVNARNLRLSNTKKGKSHRRVVGLSRLVKDCCLDIVAVQELCGTGPAQTLSSTLASELGESYGVVLSPVLSRTYSTKLERAAFIYRRSKVQPVGAPIATMPEHSNWSRRLFFAEFQVGATRFQLGTAHFNPRGKGPEKQAADMPTVIEQLKKTKLYTPRTVLIMLGDFNLPAFHGAWDALRALGFTHCLHSSIPTNKVNNKQRRQWDNILVRMPDAHARARPDSLIPLRSWVCNSSQQMRGLDSDHSVVCISHSFTPCSTMG